MVSGVGGWREASPVRRVGAMVMELSLAPDGVVARTSTVAMPGRTMGMRTVMKSWWGPAWICSKTSLEPTWARAAVGVRKSRSRRRRRIWGLFGVGFDEGEKQILWGALRRHGRGYSNYHYRGFPVRDRMTMVRGK